MGETERGVDRTQVATTHNIRTDTQTLPEYIRLVCVCVYGHENCSRIRVSVISVGVAVIVQQRQTLFVLRNKKILF